MNIALLSISVADPGEGEGLDSPLKMTYTTSYTDFSIMNAGFEKA